MTYYNGASETSSGFFSIIGEALSDLANMIDLMLSLGFMQRALIVGLLVSLCAALLGVNLVLKRYAMIGTALGNVGFMVVAIAGIIEVAPVAISMPIVILAAFLMLRMSEKSKVKGDSVVALVSTSSISIGVIFTALTTGITLHICTVMFGSFFVMTQLDMYLSIAVSVAVVVLFVLFYKQLFAVTHDEDFAKATGTKVEIYKSLLALLTAVTIVIGMRMMGAMLVAALTIFPALSAMRICKRFLSVVISSAIIGVVCFALGMLFSFGLDLPPGASVVGVNLILYIILCIASFIKRKVFAG